MRGKMLTLNSLQLVLVLLFSVGMNFAARAAAPSGGNFGPANATFSYTGNNYQVTLDQRIQIYAVGDHGAKQIVDGFYMEAFKKNWEGGAGHGRLLNYTVVKQTDTESIVDTEWKVSPLQDAQLAIRFAFYPFYFRMDFQLRCPSQGDQLLHRRVRINYGTDWNGDFSSGAEGLELSIMYDKKLWYGGSYTEYPWDWEDEAKTVAKTRVFVQPWVAGQLKAVPAPAHETSNQEAGLLGVGMPYSQTDNIFLADQVPKVTVVIQNYRETPQLVSWTLKATDFREENQFTYSDTFLVDGKGALQSRVVELPSWRGHINVSLTANAEEKTYSAQTQLAVLPDPERHYREDSIFGIMPDVIGPGRTDLMLDKLQWMGAHWVRYFSPGKDDLERYRRRGLEPMPGVGGVLQAPPGSFRFSEMTNEPNFSVLPAEYAETLKLNYLRQKQHDPNIAVGSPSTAGVDTKWFRELAENGCWDYVDYLNVHLHCFPYPPELDYAVYRDFWQASNVQFLFPLMEEYGQKPVVDSEQGYLQLDPYLRVEGQGLGATAEDNIAAAFLVRSYLEALAYGLRGKHWFVLEKYGGFGLMYHHTPRPGYSAYAVMTKMLDGAEYWGENVPDGGYFVPAGFTPPSQKSPRLYQRVFKLPNEKPLLAVWATLQRRDVINNPVETEVWKGGAPGTDQAWNGEIIHEPPEPVTATINVGAEEVLIVDLMGRQRRAASPGGTLTIQADDYPQYILGGGVSLLNAAVPFRYPRFTSELPQAEPSALVQVLLPPGGVFPKRTGVGDSENIAAALVSGQPAEFTVRVTNLGARKFKGTVALRLPQGWECTPSQQRLCIMAGAQIISEPFKIKAVAMEDGVEKIRSVIEADDGLPVADSVLNIRVAAQDN